MKLLPKGLNRSRYRKLDSGDEEKNNVSLYQIVGEYESDIENKKLSIVSPLAKGLIGKLKGDIVEINSPKGLKTYKIISVKYI